jgi:broad specificity phosphatase PhoE
MHILLVRHGETEWNVQRRIQGWTNSPLTPRGIEQVHLLGQRLLRTRIAEVHVSESQRTRETATAAMGGRDLPFYPTPELKETSWGDWEGKTAAEISAREPELWQKFVQRGHEDPTADQADWESMTLVPGGETIQHASNRVNAYVSEVVNNYLDTDACVLVVGHGGSLRFVVTALLKMRPSSAKLFHLDNASLTHFSVSRSRAVMKALNDCSHWSNGVIQP